MSQDPKNNVVSLFAHRAKKESTSTAPVLPEGENQESFEDIMKRNRENSERIRLERLKANEGVLKSYRIKKK